MAPEETTKLRGRVAGALHEYWSALPMHELLVAADVALKHGLLPAMAEAEADRDRARDAAVALEQENAQLREELGQLRLDDEIEQRATALSPADFDEPF